MKTLVSRTATLGSILILTSFALLLVGNRWANYIVTPISGIYLVDVLLVLGSFLGLANLRKARVAPAWTWILFGSVWAYVGFFLLPELLVVPQSDRYLAIRDAAPFLYLSLAPLAALSLIQLPVRILVWVTRWSALAAAVVAVLSAIGILQPSPSPLLGSEFASFFSSRLDLLGTSIGIGVIAWGSWDKTLLPAHPLIQGLLLFFGAVTVENRSGLVALVIATTIAAFRNFREHRQLRIPAVAVLLLVAGLFVQVTGLPAVNVTTIATSTPTDTTTSTPTDTTTSTPTDTTTLESLASWFQSTIYRSGTVRGRIETWALIVQGLNRDSTWLLGGSSGSDYMYELCTGESTAPIALIAGDLKCPVDDAGPSPVVRDPHNWILNIVLYHGLIGLAVFSAALVVPALKGRRTESAMLPIGGLVTYLAMGLTFLISGGYALIPMTVFVAWLVRNALAETDEVAPHLESGNGTGDNSRLPTLL